VASPIEPAHLAEPEAALPNLLAGEPGSKQFDAGSVSDVEL
jgi:hypothetical protein